MRAWTRIGIQCLSRGGRFFDKCLMLCNVNTFNLHLSVISTLSKLSAMGTRRSRDIHVRGFDLPSHLHGPRFGNLDACSKKQIFCMFPQT